MVARIYQELEAKQPKNGFTIGINDDVTFTSLDVTEHHRGAGKQSEPMRHVHRVTLMHPVRHVVTMTTSNLVPTRTWAPKAA